MNKALEFFNQMCKIPHGSSDTKKISDYLKDFANARNLECFQDKSNNIVINKAASKGCEDYTRLIIQAHMDMVCEKEDNVEFDFEKDPLNIKIDGDFIYAEGTTLGGDDISGVAIGLAILDDDSINHGPITCVFTVDEEIGMLGAIALDKSHLQGENFLLNIDNEKEGQFLTSCAGGVMIDGILPVKTKEVSGKTYEIVVSGCVGGHSGESIDKGSANAVKVLGNLLSKLYCEGKPEVISIDGGLKDNAIPRKAAAKFIFDGDVSILDESIKSLIEKYKETDPEMCITVECLGDSTQNAIEEVDKVINYIVNVKDGVVDWSNNTKGMVETSLNLGILKTDKDKIKVCHLLRSSVGASLDKLLDEVDKLMKENGFSTKAHSGYPAWEHKVDSKFREIIKNTCEEIGAPCKFEGIHAGLECGVFFEANPKLDIVSFGPDIFDIHTPAEKMSLSSFERSYNFVRTLVQKIR